MSNANSTSEVVSPLSNPFSTLAALAAAHMRPTLINFVWSLVLTLITEYQITDYICCVFRFAIFNLLQAEISNKLLLSILHVLFTYTIHLSAHTTHKCFTSSYVNKNGQLATTTKRFITSRARGNTICPCPAHCTHAAAHLSPRPTCLTPVAPSASCVCHEYSWSTGSSSLWAVA